VTDLGDIDAPTGLAAMRAAVARLSPAEASYVDATWRAYAADPLGSGRRRGDHPLGAGLPVDSVGAWAPLVISFVAQALATMALEESVRRGSGWLGRYRARRRRLRELRRTAARPLPVLTPEQLRALGESARRAAGEAGRPTDEQERFAVVIVTVLTVGGTDRADAGHRMAEGGVAEPGQTSSP
jgi:hypothetical protein